MPINIGNVPHRKRAAALQVIGGYANTGISVIQGLVLIPLYLHYIGAHTYGLWLASGGILTWLGFVDLGIDGIFVQRIARAYGQRNLPYVGAYFTNGMIIAFCMSLVFVGLGFGVSLRLPALLGVGEQANLLKQCFQLALLATGLSIINACLRAFAQALLRPVFATASLIVCRLVGLAAIIAFLIHNFGLWSIPLGSAITELSVFAFNSINATRLFRSLEVSASISMEVLKDYFRISPALFASRMGNALVLQIDPLLITMMLRPEIATAYVATKRAADIINQLLHVIIASSFPSFSQLVGEADAAKIIHAMRYIVIFIFAIGLAGLCSYVAMNQSFVTLWVGKEYFLDYHLVILIATGTLVMALRNTLGRILMGIGDVVMPSLLMLLEAIVRVSLIIILLKAIGVAGVAVALLISCSVFLVVFASRVEKGLPSAIAYGSLARAIFVALVAYGIAIMFSHYIPEVDGWLSFAAYAAMVSVGFLAGVLYIYPVIYRMAIQSMKIS